MNRKKFITNSLLGGILGAFSPMAFHSKKVDEDSTFFKLMKNVGFNHLPNKETKTMNTVIHRAETRGHANHGWLDSHHTFSFANYHNPERMHFGVLRVLNDDQVHPGKGFNTHPHDNMEIISIPLEGDLIHKDSMGNVAVIKQGDVQVMSAGIGIYHSEFNKNNDQDVKFLQIWVFPNKKNVNPRYDQISIREIETPNSFYQVLSPDPNDQGVWINQDAWFSLGKFEKETEQTYMVKSPKNGVYAFIIEGEVEIEGVTLKKRDGMGLWNKDAISIKAEKGSKVLLMDVPMTL